MEDYCTNPDAIAEALAPFIPDGFPSKIWGDHLRFPFTGTETASSVTLSGTTKSATNWGGDPNLATIWGSGEFSILVLGYAFEIGETSQDQADSAGSFIRGLTHTIDKAGNSRSFFASPGAWITAPPNISGATGDAWAAVPQVGTVITRALTWPQFVMLDEDTWTIEWEASNLAAAAAVSCNLHVRGYAMPKRVAEAVRTRARNLPPRIRKQLLAGALLRSAGHA